MVGGAAGVQLHYQDNVSLSTHLGPRFKEGKRHLSYKDSCNLVPLLRGGGDATSGDPWTPARALGPAIHPYYGAVVSASD